ncbi:unnamed protein product [Pipistrellus nathusii]|uniref:Uncharacterized protein n=1 Tax=Pipistrellus nathusii TaxID=59473 RepID=A0ABN9Z439_PIPNA
MKIFVFTFIMALLVAMISADSSEEKHHFCKKRYNNPPNYPEYPSNYPEYPPNYPQNPPIYPYPYPYPNEEK